MLSADEFWSQVKRLEGKTLYTFVEFEPNHIIKVEDSGKATDAIIIKDRETRPIRIDVFAAYEILYKQGRLERKKDLSWLAEPNKKTSSIVFSIIAQITKDFVTVENKTVPVLKLKSL